MSKRKSPRFFRLILSSLLLAATSCTPPAMRPADAARSATQAAFMVQTAIVQASLTPTITLTQLPTSTLTPRPGDTATPTETPVPVDASGYTATPAPLPLEVTALPGLKLYDNSQFAYIFQYDPAAWQPDPTGKSASLVHQSLSGCRVDPVLPRGIGAPERLAWTDQGRFRWEVLDYGSNALVSPVQPVIQQTLPELTTPYLDLRGFGSAKCRATQEELLAGAMTRAEAAGQIAYQPYLTPTLRPPLDGYSCPNTPPARLRVGDLAAVVTDAVRLRSDPSAASDNTVRKILRGAPYIIHVTGGPVCEKFTYWQVDVSTIGEGSSQTYQGWIAEGDPSEVYIAPVK